MHVKYNYWYNYHMQGLYLKRKHSFCMELTQSKKGHTHQTSLSVLKEAGWETRDPTFIAKRYLHQTQGHT